MKKFFNKAKAAYDEHQGGNEPPSQTDGPQDQQPIGQQPGPGQGQGIQAPTPADVFRYRYHHGANLGSVFILEKWLTGSMFPDGCSGSSELAAAEGWAKKEGIDAARQRFEKHWREYVSDADLDWLRDSGHCTTVRLPIGWFTLGPPYCDGTAFKSVSGIYQNAWPAVKQLVQRCQQRGIGVLIDMHGLPGGANAQEHSGTNSGKAEFWGSKKDRELATRCLCFIVKEVRNLEGVAGIQIINEAEWDAKHMYDWYSDVLNEVAKIDPSMPIYISDAWDLNRCASWTQGRNSIKVAHANPVVVDTHLYWCFSDADKRKSPQQISQEVQGKLGALDGKDGSVIDRGAAQAVVGEYSCVLAEDSWAKGAGTAKQQLVQQFGNAESQRFQQRAGGSFFWTYRMDWMEGGEWGFKQMTKQGAIVPPQSLQLSVDDVRRRVEHAQSQQQQRKEGSVGGHCRYWDGVGGQYEHWRFEQGWDVGFGDAMAVFGTRAQSGVSGGDKIGMLDLWCLKRLRESGQGGSKYGWEFEQGLRQGVSNFYQCVGV